MARSSALIGAESRRSYAVMFRRSPSHFYVFDLIELNGIDLRSLQLLKRKQLRQVIPTRSVSVP